MNRTALMLALALLTAAPGASLGDTIRVDASGGGDYLSIQEGLDAAQDGDTILVAAGTYIGENNRALTFGYKNLVVQAESGFASVTIDCQGLDRAFYLYDTGQDTTSVIRDLIIVNGYTSDYNGGGMLVTGIGIIIEDCLFENCEASHNGGALYSGYSLVGPSVRNCVFIGNHAPYRGGAVETDHSSARFRLCLFSGNWTTDGGTPSSGGGGFYCNHAEYSEGWICRVSRCTFVGNTSGGMGTGVAAWDSESGFMVSRSIVAFNSGAGLGFDSDPMIENLTFSDIYGNEGGNVAIGYSTLMHEDPRFCGMASGEFTLCANSPCLPTGNPWGLLGFADAGCGDCEAAVQEATWGAIKGMFR